MKVLKTLSTVVAILISLALTGCVSLDSRVTRFHKLEKDASGSYGSYAFFIPQDKQNSLEFATYVDRTKAYLNNMGFTEARSADTADMLAFLNYSIQSSGSTSTYTPPARMSGTSSFAQGFNSASTGSISTSDEYLRTVSLRLAKFSSAGAPPQTLYEGTVVSLGSSGDFNAVMPTMIKALFVEFPGRSGETVRRTLPLEK